MTRRQPAIPITNIQLRTWARIVTRKSNISTPPNHVGSIVATPGFHGKAGIIDSVTACDASNALLGHYHYHKGHSIQSHAFLAESGQTQLPFGLLSPGNAGSLLSAM